MLQALWRTVWVFLKKLKMEIPCDTAISLLGIYPEKTIITRIPMLIAAIFTTAKTWEQHKCPSTDEWMKKMWYTYIHQFSSVQSLSRVRLFATP